MAIKTIYSPRFFKVLYFSIKYLLFLLILTLHFNTVYSQLIQQWVSRYNGSGNFIDMIDAMEIDTAGNVYVTGQSFTGSQTYDYCSIKYNASGVQKWVALYNGSGNGTDIAYAICSDASGNVYVTGSSPHAYGAQNEDIVTIKYDSNGVQQWVAVYNGASNGPDEGKCIVTDNAGNCYVAGYTYSNASNYNYVVIKYNSSGIQQWVTYYDGPASGGDEPTAMSIDKNSNIYVSGNSHGIGTGNDYCTIKYNPSGAQQWVARYDGPGSGDDIAYSLTIDTSLNVIVTGTSLGAGTGDDYATAKYNSSGVQQWVQRFNGSGNNNDAAKKVIVDKSNNVFVTGSATGASSGYDFCTIKYSPSGVQQWVGIYDGPASGSDEAASIVIDTGGYIYTGGYSYGISSSADFCIVQYYPTGVQKSVTNYNGTGNSGDYINSMSLSTRGLFVGGFSQGSGTNYDFTVVKYSNVVGIKNENNNVPENFKLYQNYPNPFNPVTTIRFDIPALSHIKLNIYDILGRSVSEIVNKEIPAGSYESDWNASNFSSGIYFYKIEVYDLKKGSIGFTGVKKMILTK